MRIRLSAAKQSRATGSRRPCRFAIVAACWLLIAVAGACQAHAQTPSGVQSSGGGVKTGGLSVRELLRGWVETADPVALPTTYRQGFQAVREISRFYEIRGFSPAWSQDGFPTPQVDSLLAVIRAADGDGLDPLDYHATEIERIVRQLDAIPPPAGAIRDELLRDLDLNLTDAWLLLGAHMLVGRVHPETFDPLWRASVREADLVQLLDQGLQKGNAASALRRLAPDPPGYARLKGALKRYRTIALGGGWPSVPGGMVLRPGDVGPAIAALRARLCATGDVASGCESNLYDQDLESGVRAFQARHGLATDAVVGPATLAALNVTAAERSRQIELNLERWRWLPESLGTRYILVNIASFTLSVRDSGRDVLRMPVVVGRQARRTPVFSDRMTYLVLCPSWNVPHTIATQDILPAVRKDSTYLEKRRMRVIEGWEAGGRVVDPGEIGWTGLTAKNFRYRFRQDPGPDNALGSIKFMFPNKFDVYLHDTPARELFGKVERTFSSGCIRLSEPMALALFLLRGASQWDPASIRAAIATWREQTVRLPAPIDIHLEYWTAWVEPDGAVNFRKDVYERDSALSRALSARHGSR